MLRRPQFSKHPIPRTKRIKRLQYTAQPTEVDVTGEVLLGAATARPTGTLIEVDSAAERTPDRIGFSLHKKIRERAEEMREAERRKRVNPRGFYAW